MKLLFHFDRVIMRKSAKADVVPKRQRTQYTCMTTSVSMCLQALGHPHADEDTVNKTLGAMPMRGACWEQALACCNHYGFRSTLIVPATLPQLKQYTDQGFPIIIAYNPEGKDWSHASVIFDITDDLTVHIADPNMADPDETVRVMSKSEFYRVWSEPYNGYTIRRPAMVIQPEISTDGRQLLASYFDKSKENKPMSKKASDLAKLSEELEILSEQMIMGKSKKKKKKNKSQPTTEPAGHKSKTVTVRGKPKKQRNELHRKFVEDGRPGGGVHKNKKKYDRKNKSWKAEASLQQPLQTRPDYGVRNAELEEQAMKMSELDMLAMELQARILGKKGPDGKERPQAEIDKSKEDHFGKGGWKSISEKKSETMVSEQEIDAVEEALLSMMENGEMEKMALLNNDIDNLLTNLETTIANPPKSEKKASVPQRTRMTERTAATGLYGFTKGIQKDCESAIRKVSKSAARIAKQLWTKDQGTCAFLNTHAKRGKSLTAKVILTAMKELGPKVATFHQLRRATYYAKQYQPIEKMAGKSGYGLYGFKSKTAQLSLSACSQLKAEVGEITSDLHNRRKEKRASIVGFLSDHKKVGKCLYSKLMLNAYPDESMKMASEFIPDSVQGWIEWED